MTEIERLREALEAFQSYGCPVCHGDCASANPPVMCCPMQQARAALSTPPAAERGEWRDMDSAPRDGTKIDLLYPYPRGRTVDCYWDDAFVKGWCWRTPVWKRGELLPEREWDWGSYPNATPLGWMPAPPSPRTPEGQI